MKLLTRLALLADDGNATFWDKVKYVFILLSTSSPIVYFLNAIGEWFENNSQFVSFLLVVFGINMAVGIVFHLSKNTFSWEEFLKRNALMWFVCICMYWVLEMLRITVGNNDIGHIFGITIQLITLMYPASKIAKNIYILTKGKYPPEFIMNRLYNFEKTGDPNDLLNNKIQEDEIR